MRWIVVVVGVLGIVGAGAAGVAFGMGLGWGSGVERGHLEACGWTCNVNGMAGPVWRGVDGCGCTETVRTAIR